MGAVDAGDDGVRVLAAWEDADPDFAPMLDARQAVERL